MSEKTTNDPNDCFLSSGTASNSKIKVLPLEVLAYIFKVVQLRGIKFTRTPLSWVREITHICALWREVALSLPSLWTYLPVYHEHDEIYEIFMNRSNTLNVTFEINLSTSDSFRKLEDLLIKKNSRISGLVCYATHAMHLQRLVGRLSKFTPFPCLQSILIHGWVTSAHKLVSGITPDTLTDKLLQENTLKFLELPAPPSWKSRTMGNLVALRIHNSAMFPQPHGQDVLHALQEMAHTLQYLHLTDDVLPNDLPHLPQSSEVNLLRIRECHLSDKFQNIANFLRHLKLPDDALLDLTCHDSAPPTLSLLQAEISRWASNFDPGLRSMSCTLWNMGILRNMSFECWSYSTRHSERRNELVAPDYQPLLALKLQWAGLGMAPPSEIHSVLDCVFQALPTERLEYLALNSMVEFAENALESKPILTLLQGLDELRSIYVRGIFIEPFIEALASDTQADSAAPVPFRKLRYALLEDDLVYQHSDSISQKVLRFHPITLVETLADKLDKRLEQEAGIDCLTLKNCYFLIEEDVEILQDLADIVWERTLTLNAARITEPIWKGLMK